MFGKAVIILFSLFVASYENMNVGERIVGGSVAKTFYPYQLSLQKYSPTTGPFSSKYHHFCGGSIISEDYLLTASKLIGFPLHMCYLGEHFLLTAAHCVENQILANISVLAGTANLREDSKGSRHSIESCLIHPNYFNMTNDIAVCRAKTPFVFGQDIGKIIIQNSYVEHSGE